IRAVDLLDQPAHAIVGIVAGARTQEVGCAFAAYPAFDGVAVGVISGTVGETAETAFAIGARVVGERMCLATGTFRGHTAQSVIGIGRDGTVIARQRRHPTICIIGIVSGARVWAGGSPELSQAVVCIGSHQSTRIGALTGLITQVVPDPGESGIGIGD